MIQKLRYQYAMSNLLTKIIAINVVVFLVVNIAFIISKWSNLDFMFMYNIVSPASFKPINWLSSTAALNQLIYKPWSLLTYMFLHEGFWHILSNMLVLYYMGTIFCDLLGERKFLPTYIFGGIAGLVFYIGCYNLFPFFKDSLGAPIWGASASVMAVMFATASYFPDYEIRLILIGNVKLKWIALIYLLIDLLALKGMSNLGGHLAHLGGAAYGFAYAKNLSGKGSGDWSDAFYAIVNVFANLFKPKSKIKVAYRNEKYTDATTDRSKKVDEILDKISRSGYDSLSKDEKETLFKASKE